MDSANYLNPKSLRCFLCSSGVSPDGKYPGCVETFLYFTHMFKLFYFFQKKK